MDLDFNNLSDEEIVELAKGGDRDALDFLLGKYKMLASKIARSYFLIGGESEDILQEAMIGLYKAYISYDENLKAKFMTFANICITRQVQSAIRHANTQKNKILNDYVPITNQGSIVVNSNDSNESIVIFLPSNSPSPDALMLAQEREEEIKKFIKSSLTLLEQNVLSEYLKGKSYAEISKKLNISLKAIDNAISRVKSKFNCLKLKD